MTQEMRDKRVADIATAAQSTNDQVVVGDVAVSRTGIAFSMENRTNSEFIYGEPYDVACYADGDWVPVTHLPGAGGGYWTLPAYPLPSGETKQYRREWDWRFGELPPGRYMFLLGGWLGKWHPNIETLYAIVIFDITADSPVSFPEADGENQFR